MKRWCRLNLREDITISLCKKKKNKLNNKSRQSETVVGNIPSRSILNSQLAFQTKTLKSSKFSLFFNRVNSAIKPQVPKVQGAVLCGPGRESYKHFQQLDNNCSCKIQKKSANTEKYLLTVLLCNICII